MIVELHNAQLAAGAGEERLGPFTLSLNSGVSALMGPNGSGKTTLIRSIAGLLPLAGGKLSRRWQGRELPFMELRLLMGYMPQTLAIHDGMTFLQYLSYIAELKCINRRHLTQEINRVAETVGLLDLLGQPMKAASEGQQRRMMLAQALLGRPRLLLLDEPFSGVDMEYRRKLLLLLQEYAEAAQAVVVIASHHVEEFEPEDYNQVIAI